MKELTREAMRFEETGQDRPPRRGEWYMGMLGAPALAPKDFAMRCLPILKRVDNGPREELELERERLDAEAREEARLNAGQGDERTTGFPAPDSGCESRAPLQPAPTRTQKQSDLRPLRDTARKVRHQYLPYSESEEEP